MRVKIRGKLWTVKDAKIDADKFGVCTWPMRLIEIQVGQGKKERLDTIIHEMLHALCPAMSEKMIIRLAGAITKVLWDDGWRKHQKNR